MSEDLSATTEPPSRHELPWMQFAISLSGAGYLFHGIDHLCRFFRVDVAGLFEPASALCLFAAVACGLRGAWQSHVLRKRFEEPPWWPPLRQVNIGLWSLTSGLLVLLYLLSTRPGVPSPEGPPNEATEWTRTKAAKTPNGRFAIDVPEAWIEHHQNPAKIQEILQSSPTQHLFVNVTIVSEDDLAISDLDRFSTLVLNRMKAEFGDVAIRRTVPAAVLGTTGREIIARSLVQGREVEFLIQFAHVGRAYVCLRAGGNPDVVHDREHSLRVILSTFREIAQTTTRD